MNESPIEEKPVFKFTLYVLGGVALIALSVFLGPQVYEYFTNSGDGTHVFPGDGSGTTGKFNGEDRDYGNKTIEEERVAGPSRKSFQAHRDMSPEPTATEEFFRDPSQPRPDSPHRSDSPHNYAQNENLTSPTQAWQDVLNSPSKLIPNNVKEAFAKVTGKLPVIDDVVTDEAISDSDSDSDTDSDSESVATVTPNSPKGKEKA